MRSLPWTLAFLCILMVIPLGVHAQVSDDSVIDALLSQKSITWDNAAWLVGRASGGLDDAVAPADAALKAVKAGWGQGLDAQTPVNLGSYSQLLVSALHVPAGFFYQLFPGPRYAYRELVFRHLIPGTSAPDAPVSGQDAMLYLQNVQTWKESHQ